MTSTGRRRDKLEQDESERSAMETVFLRPRKMMENILRK